MLLRLCLLIVFILLISFPKNQTSNSSYRIFYKQAENLYSSENPTANTDSIALANYKKVIIQLGNKHENDSVLFDSYIKAGILLSSEKNNSKQSLQYFLQALRLNDSITALPDSINFQPYLFAGNNYDDLLNFDSALYCYKQAESLLSKFPGLPDAERLYNKTGVLYYEAGDYKKSITYFQKALAIVEEQPIKNEYFIVNYKNNIASAYRKLQQYNEALTTYQSLLKYNINRDELLHNIGVTYFDEGNFENAITFLKQVKYNTAAKFNDVGQAYLKLARYDDAELSFKTAIDLSNKVAGKNLDYSKALKNNGDLSLQLNEPQHALNYYQKALIQAAPGFNDTMQTHNPASMQGLQHAFYLFDILIKKAQAFNSLYLAHKKSDYLLNAFQTYQSAIKLSEQMERFYSSDESKFFLKKNVADAYQFIVETGIQLYKLTKDIAYLQDVFNYIENNKASVLQANVESLELNTIKGLPTTLLIEEKNLKAAISKLNLEETQTIDSSLKISVEIKTRDLEIQLSTLQTKLDENEKYHDLKFYSKHVSIDSIQKKVLAKDEAIISYYATQQSLLCFYITKDDYGYVDTKPQQLKEKVSALRKALNEPQYLDRASMQELTTSISDVLIKPVFDKIKTAKRLVVIPHNEISYVPFETLYEPNSTDLLLNRFAISYNYSINFLSANDKNASNKFSVLSVAPFINTTNQKLYPHLTSSFDEIKELPGKQLLSANATKQTFLNNAANFSIIHLATHAVANDTLPLHSFIAFYPETKDTAWHLYEPEIYYLNLTQTQLVVLSACETGSGELINGEGIMSLSRAFSYAGCKSVVTSLWKADDMATAFITKHMHQYLEKGYAKDEALQKAKLDYLNSNDIEARYKAPYYWAHLVLIGDYHAIVAKHSYWLWVVLLAITLVTILIFRKEFKANLITSY